MCILYGYNKDSSKAGKNYLWWHKHWSFDFMFWWIREHDWNTEYIHQNVSLFFLVMSSSIKSLYFSHVHCFNKTCHTKFKLRCLRHQRSCFSDIQDDVLAHGKWHLHLQVSSPSPIFNSCLSESWQGLKFLLLWGLLSESALIRENLKIW